MDQDLIKKTLAIAQKALKACDTKEGFIAGTHHFVDLWARDSFFACLGDFEGKTTKKTLETFLKFQREDGLIPYRVRRSSVSFKKYIGKPELLEKPVADFRSFQSGGTVYDGGLCLVIAFSDYFFKTKDEKFLRTYYDSLVKALKFYEKKFKRGLIKEWFLCEYNDAVLKSGKVLYTNVLYLKALKEMIGFAKTLGETLDQEFFRELSSEVYLEFEKTFWLGRYFADWVDYKRHDFLAVFSNSLLVWWGLCPSDKAGYIVNSIKNRATRENFVDRVDRKYPFWRIPILNYLALVPDYANGLIWLQPWLTYCLACLKIGETQEAGKYFEKLCQLVVKDNEVFELHERNLEPVKRWFYKSECPFAWSAGMLVLACQEFLKD